MLGANDIEGGLTAAWRLATRDPGGLALLDTSPRGFWHSFQVAVLVFPIYALVIAGRLSDMDSSADWEAVLLAEVIAYVIYWTAMPVLIEPIARWLDRGHVYVRFVVAMNWANAIQLALFALVAVLGFIGLPRGLVAFAGLVVTIWVIAYQWFVARAALDITARRAAGIVVLDVVLGLVVNSLTRHIEG